MNKLIDYKQLKSGTDIRGIASDKGGKEINLTDDAIRDITLGFAKWIVEYTGKTAENIKIAVGHDSRISAQRIKSAVIKGLVLSGFTVFDCGLSSTPSMFMTTVKADMDGAIQITASHHPFDRNGLKFFTKDGGLDSPDISKIIEYAENTENPDKSGSVRSLDFIKDYAAILRDTICKGLGCLESDMPLSGFHIIVDAGNGAGGFYANEVLKPLGADTTGSQFLEPDGMFPNHIPNPEDKTAMQSICDATEKSGADLGIIFDTDVDRAGCVDKNGNEINRNRLIALASSIALEGNEGGTIVTDSVTSDGLKEFIEQTLNGKHYRYKRGYRNVINKAVELCDRGINCPLAIETSGHAALKENYFLDDGAYLITKIIIKLAKLKQQGLDLDDLIGSMPQPAEEAEIRFPIKHDNFKDYGEKVVKELEEFSAKKPDWRIAGDNREGIRVSVDEGWFLLRLSVHDPIMPLNFESNKKGGVTATAKKLLEFFKTCDGLDITPLESLV